MSLSQCSWNKANKGEENWLTALPQVPHKPNFETNISALPTRRCRGMRRGRAPALNTGSKGSPIPSAEMSTSGPPSGPQACLCAHLESGGF